MASDSRPPDEKDVWVGEADIVYCFDFQDDPAVTGGAVLTSPVVVQENAKVNVTGATVTSVDFEHKDRAGNVLRTVPAGKGVKVSVDGVAKGTCLVKCQVTATNGSEVQQPIVPVVFRVKG